MHTQIDQQVVGRFYEAIDALKDGGNGEGKGQTLVTEYGISSLWLLTGLGKMFLPMFEKPTNVSENGQ